MIDFDSETKGIMSRKQTEERFLVLAAKNKKKFNNKSKIIKFRLLDEWE